MWGRVCVQYMGRKGFVCKEGCELLKERVGFDCFVCLVMLWLAEEESCGENSGVIRPLLRRQVTCALRTLTHNYGWPRER